MSNEYERLKNISRNQLYKTEAKFRKKNRLPKKPGELEMEQYQKLFEDE